MTEVDWNRWLQYSEWSERNALRKEVLLSVKEEYLDEIKDCDQRIENYRDDGNLHKVKVYQETKAGLEKDIRDLEKDIGGLEND